MRVFLLSDNLTRESLSIEPEIEIQNVLGRVHFVYTSFFHKPDFLLVESAWQGYKNRWKYKIANYPDVPKRNNHQLIRLVERVKERGIPTVFWNKEDGVHFHRFIDSAKHFDYVFTVDANCISKYKEVMGEHASVHTMMFAVQPKFHFFSGFNFELYKANFVGSYSHHIHSVRRQWQNMMFKSAISSGLGLTVVDRNSGRKSANYRYPSLEGVEIFPEVPYPETANIYKKYLVSLNVNTVTDSPTMFSRRLLEILACGGIAVTNPSVAVNTLFKEYCHVVSSEEEMFDLFSRLKYGPSADDLERARAGAEYVMKYHTWAHRLQQILSVISR